MAPRTFNPRTADQAAAALGARQHCLLTRSDALRCGLTDEQLDERVAHRGWSRWARGLFVLPGAGPPTWRRAAMAACLLGGADAIASHFTAGALHEMCAPPVLPHIIVPRSQSARSPLARVHRMDVARADRTWIDGIPCATAARALVDCASGVERHVLEEMVDQGFFGGRASPASVRASLERAGRRGRAGVGALLETLAVWDSDIAPDSPAEVRFLRRLVEWGVTDAVTQHPVYDDEGVLVAVIDVAIPPRLHGFEYDSDLFHGPRRYGADECRHARLKALGWRIDHVSKVDLLPSATRVPELLRARRAA